MNFMFLMKPDLSKVKHAKVFTSESKGEKGGPFFIIFEVQCNHLYCLFACFKICHI